MKGAYILFIFLDQGGIIKAGKRKFSFDKGYYCYVGSALNNLQKRVERHQRKEKKKFWHIDYFLEHGKIIDVKKIITNKKIECKLADKVKNASDKVIIGFGASDCKCKGHLFYFRKLNRKNFKELNQTN
jgi:Uri superfamily endonuclease